MSASVKVTAKAGPGADTLKQIQRLFARNELRVGVFGGATKPEGEGEKSIPLPYLGAIHELGLGVPQRSFLRAYVDGNRATINEATLRLIKSRGADPVVLELLGQFIVGEIQKRMAVGIPPPNAPSTIARKGSSTPLIHHGQLRAAVSYVVKKGA